MKQCTPMIYSIFFVASQNFLSGPRTYILYTYTSDRNCNHIKYSKTSTAYIRLVTLKIPDI